MIKVLIADDHVIVREGLKSIFSNTYDITVAEEVGSGHEVLNKIIKNNYDIVLLDVNLPSNYGLDILVEIKKEKPKLPVLILSMHPEEQYGFQSIKAGASGYLSKNIKPDEIIRAIRRVLNNGTYLSLSLADKLAFSRHNNNKKALHKTLSRREYQIFLMIGSGKTVKKIADELYLSVKTVSNHRARILKKMVMKTNTELIYYAIKNKLVY